MTWTVPSMSGPGWQSWLSSNRGDQSQDRQSPRPHDPAITAAAGGSGHRVMRRRAFLSGIASFIATPLAAEAQQAGKMYRIGVLCQVPCQGRAVDAFVRALRELGYVEGRTVEFDYRDAEGKVEPLAALTTDLVQRKVDVIFTSWGTAAALAAKRATNTIPVVIGAVGDPVRAGIVTSLAKPGGNVTGVSSLALELEGSGWDW